MILFKNVILSYFIPYLEKIYLQHKKLVVIIPNEVVNLSYLKKLDSGQFHLSGTIPSDVLNLQNLQHLSLQKKITFVEAFYLSLYDA